MGNSLRSALDQLRSNINEYEVKMIRLENYGVSRNQLIIALTLIGGGIVTYYFIPRAFL